MEDISISYSKMVIAIRYKGFSINFYSQANKYDTM